MVNIRELSRLHCHSCCGSLELRNSIFLLCPPGLLFIRKLLLLLYQSRWIQKTGQKRQKNRILPAPISTQVAIWLLLWMFAANSAHPSWIQNSRTPVKRVINDFRWRCYLKPYRSKMWWRDELSVNIDRCEMAKKRLHSCHIIEYTNTAQIKRRSNIENIVCCCCCFAYLFYIAIVTSFHILLILSVAIVVIACVCVCRWCGYFVAAVEVVVQILSFQSQFTMHDVCRRRPFLLYCCFRYQESLSRLVGMCCMLNIRAACLFTLSHSSNSSSVYYLISFGF